MSQPDYRPGLADVPAAESAISFIDGKRARLEYRGIAAEGLARESSYEDVAYLLLKGELPTQKQLADFDKELRSRRKLHFRMYDVFKAMPSAGHPMDALQAAIPIVGMYQENRRKDDEASNWDNALRLIAVFPTVVAAFHRIRNGHEPIEPRDDLDHAANFYHMLFAKQPSPAQRKVLDACLILHAEHTMNASTFTARVVGSTLADAYATISAAIGALSGPLHGGANEEVVQMLAGIGSVDKAKAWLDAAIANKSKIMGFGHRVYKVKDPRATVVQELAEQMFAESGHPPMYDLALEVEKAAMPTLGAKGIYPNVDFFSGIVYLALGIPRDLFTPIFAIARVTGWLAHWLEQIKDNKLFRPEQIYVGRNDVNFVSLEQRAN